MITPAESLVAALRDTLPWTTPRLRLRPLSGADTPAVAAYRSLPQIALHLHHPPLGHDATEALLREWSADPARLTLGIEIDLIRSPGTLIGDVGLRFRTGSAKAPGISTAVEASLGYALHPDHQGRGLATEAVRACLDRVFAAGLRRVTADVFAGASGSSALLDRLGFHLDGIDRAAVLAPDGHTWWDDERWSLLAAEHLARPLGPDGPATPS